MLRQYREEILKLKSLLESMSSGGGDGGGGTTVAMDNDTKAVMTLPSEGRTSAGGAGDRDRERETLRLEAEEKKRHELQRLTESQALEKESLKREMENLKVYYENKLNSNISSQPPPTIPTTITATAKTNPTMNKEEICQRINDMESSFIGGERASDVQLLERRNKKKMASINRQK